MGHTYAAADWHGEGKVANKILEWLKPEDTLYFLGDAIDRGPDGIEIFDKLINRPNTYFLCGNHEDMMAKAIPSCLNFAYGADAQMAYIHWLQNGGGDTWNNGLRGRSKEEVLDYMYKIHELSLREIYQSPLGHTVILEHAGDSPFIYKESHDYLWDRSHFHNGWEGTVTILNNEGEALDLKTTYLVHGHTPVQYLKFEYGYKTMEPITREERLHKHDWWKAKENTNPKVIRYCKGHKFDIDLCTVVSKKAVLLDLDTFEEIYFEEED